VRLLGKLLPALLVSWALCACTAVFQPELAQLADQPLTAEPHAIGIEPWSFADHQGELIKTSNFHIYTTMNDPLFQHLLIRVLEAAHERVSTHTPAFRSAKPLDCYIFSSRSQWESYTRARAGSNAPIYLQISAGGYCQEGVFAGYDIGRDQTLSVIAHEAFHQYSWFAFKSRLPSWLEEGMATQNEAIEWVAGEPRFKPELNTSRLTALRQALRGNSLWSLSDLLATHAGRVIKMPQASIDAYYAQLWSFVLFLQRSPSYAPRLDALLADASAGTLTQALQGTTVTPSEIDNFTERWNTIAGPVYLQKYINPDLAALEKEYLAWARDLIRQPN
jgi:hypothetical protein